MSRIRRFDHVGITVADEAGVSRVTARRYLDHLCQLGKVELTMRYGGPGRPEHRYRLMTSLPASR